MKLAPILAQFLYCQKRLDLEGIGSFFLSPNASIPDTDPGRQPRTIIHDGISFESNPSIRESGELIGYISSQTGKMKALASADLNSFLELGLQFLNIGKPFMIEGIGSLVKIRSGVFEFTPGLLLPEKMKDRSLKEHPVVSTEENFSKYEPFLEKEKTKTEWKRPVLVLLVIGGIGLAVLGGYTIYKRNISPKKQILIAAETAPVVANLVDSASIAKKDSLSSISSTATVPEGNYKFVLETAGRTRALDRYQKLRTYGWKVKMETSDSVRYKLYLLVPALTADTTRVLDSLTALNGRKVYIEN